MKINPPSFYKKYIRIIPGIRSYALASIFVLLFGLTVTFLSWYVDKQRIEDQKTTQLEEQKETIENNITNRLAIYEQILRGAGGLFQASENVSQADWQQFVKGFNLEKTYPGVKSVGFIQYLQGAQADSYTQSLRAQGYNNFSITPAGVRNEYAPVTYIEPLTPAAQQAIGYDILTDSQRASPANKARDTGRVGLSEKLVLLSDRGSNEQSSFAMYVATYNKNTDISTIENRRNGLTGFVVASFQAGSFFEQTIDPSRFEAYEAVQIFDGNNNDTKSLLYQSKNFSNFDDNKLSQTFTTPVFDRTWTLQFAGQKPANEQDQQRSAMILAGGSTISFAIAGFLFLVMFTRARAIVYSKQYETQQAKDDLLSLASHQLRTPATAVKQYLGMILEGYTGKINSKQLPALQKAYVSNERQLDTINQILYVAKADAGRLSINKSKFDLHQLIDDIVLDLKETFDENKQKLTVERTAKKLVIDADEASIRMVVENLISNASKYSHSGSKIKVKSGIEKDKVVISVIDKGVGIAAQDFDQLFKKFSRIDNDLSVQVGGSGIGLYIDKVLIELHNGHIDVKSHPGKGSTFSIVLPIDPANNLTDGDNNNGSL